MKNILDALSKCAVFGELVLDHQLCVLSVNDLLADALGCSADALCGRLLSDAFPGVQIIPAACTPGLEPSCQQKGSTGHCSVSFPTVFRLPARQGSIDCFAWFTYEATDHTSRSVCFFDTLSGDDSGRQSLITIARYAQQLSCENQWLVKSLARSGEELLRSEKLAGIGQLAAGVAHEINNPMGYIFSNLKTLSGYMNDLIKIIDVIDHAQDLSELRKLKQTLEYDYIRSDAQALIDESEEGVSRVKKIIKALKDFSHNDEEGFRYVDLLQGFETTLNIVQHEIKHTAVLVREYTDLPLVECNASQINQVFMNLLINAAQAMTTTGQITVRTGLESGMVWFEVEDTGQGMSPDVQHRIFEPFFTTKPMGKGSGLGLALSYTIIEKHHGRITVTSQPDQGTCIRVILPLSQGDTLHRVVSQGVTA